MKILAVTDIHGANHRVVEMINLENPDLLIIGGDLTTYGSVDHVRKALDMFKPACRAMLCISGNMDSRDHDTFYTDAGISINGKGFMFGDVGIFGVSAAPFSPLHTPYEISEDAIASVMQAGYLEVASARLKILVSHAPPEGTTVDLIRSGKHVGSKAVRQFIETEQPAAVICGHIHEARGIDKLGSSIIVNCGEGSKGYYAVLLNDHEKVNIQNKQL
jgi:Icc-related predicted phosphoesterase